MTHLSAMIVRFRAELAGELPIKLHEFASNGRHSKGGAAEGEVSTGAPVERRMQHRPGDIGMTGLPFSRAFDRYLSGQHGGEFIAADAFTEIRDFCRREHWREQHTAENPFAWNLCARIAIAAVELRQPLAFIAEQEGIDLWLARNLLTTALEHAEKWREDRRKGVIIGDESRKQLDEAEAIPVLLAREHRVEDEERVWELWRAKFPYLRPWESELDRRRAFHATHCVEHCALLMDDAA